MISLDTTISKISCYIGQSIIEKNDHTGPHYKVVLTGITADGCVLVDVLYGSNSRTAEELLHKLTVPKDTIFITCGKKIRFESIGSQGLVIFTCLDDRIEH